MDAEDVVTIRPIQGKSCVAGCCKKVFGCGGGMPHPQIDRTTDFQHTVRETLIYSEFPWHRDVPPFSMRFNALKMMPKAKPCFAYGDALIIHG